VDMEQTEKNSMDCYVGECVVSWFCYIWIHVTDYERHRKKKSRREGVQAFHNKYIEDPLFPKVFSRNW
jgi:hypothetical protein